MKSDKRVFARLKNAFKNDETFSNINIKTFIYITLTVVLFQMGENVSSVFEYVGAVVLLVGLLFIDQDQIVFAYIVFAVSNRLLTLGSIPLLPVLTIVYFAKEYIFRKGYKKSDLDSQMMIMMGLNVLYSQRYFLTSPVISNYYLMVSLKLIFSFPMLIDFFKKCKTKKEVIVKFNQMVFYMLFCTVVTVAVSGAFVSSKDNALSRFSISDASGANLLAIYVACALGTAVVVMLSENTLLLKRVIGVLMIPVAYVGLLTQSRTFVVLSIIIIAWVLIFGFKNEGSRKTTGIFVIIAVVVSMAFLIFEKNTDLYQLFEAIIDRFINPKHDDITAGRLRIAQAYLKMIFSSWKYILFGSDGSLGSPTGGIVAHNMYIEVLYNMGIFGFILVFFMYAVFFNKIKESFVKVGLNKATLVGALPFILCFTGGLSSHTILGAMPTNEFFIGVCAMYYYHAAVSNKKEKLLYKRDLYKRTYNFNSTDSDIAKGE